VEQISRTGNSLDSRTSYNAGSPAEWRYIRGQVSFYCVKSATFSTCSDFSSARDFPAKNESVIDMLG